MTMPTKMTDLAFLCKAACAARLEAVDAPDYEAP